MSKMFAAATFCFLLFFHRLNFYPMIFSDDSPHQQVDRLTIDKRVAGILASLIKSVAAEAPFSIIARRYFVEETAAVDSIFTALRSDDPTLTLLLHVMLPAGKIVSAYLRRSLDCSPWNVISLREALLERLRSIIQLDHSNAFRDLYQGSIILHFFRRAEGFLIEVKV